MLQEHKDLMQLLSHISSGVSSSVKEMHFVQTRTIQGSVQPATPRTGGGLKSLFLSKEFGGWDRAGPQPAVFDRRDQHSATE